MSCLNGRERLFDPGHQGLQCGQRVVRRTKHHNRKRIPVKILLRSEIAVNCNKHVELICHKPQ